MTQQPEDRTPPHPSTPEIGCGLPRRPRTGIPERTRAVPRRAERGERARCSGGPFGIGRSPQRRSGRPNQTPGRCAGRMPPRNSPAHAPRVAGRELRGAARRRAERSSPSPDKRRAAGRGRSGRAVARGLRRGVVTSRRRRPWLARGPPLAKCELRRARAAGGRASGRRSGVRLGGGGGTGQRAILQWQWWETALNNASDIT